MRHRPAAPPAGTRLSWVVPLGLVLSLIGLPPSASAADPRAERLAELRAEVDALQSALELDREALRGEQRAVDAQEADLEVQLRREELRLERLRSAEAALVAATSTEGPDPLAPLLEQALSALEAQVRAGLPFRVNDRLKALSDLSADLRGGRLSPAQVAARAWAFVEDERRLARSNGLDRQVIAVDGDELLVEVVRLGLVALYWRAPDSRVGLAAPGPDGAWTFRALQGAEAADVEALFAAFGRGLRGGAFTLPLPTGPGATGPGADGGRP